MDNVEAKLTKNLHQLSDGGKMAIVMCANSFRFGGNWGLLRTTNKDFHGILETLLQEKPSVRAVRTRNGALILCSENFLAYNVNLAVPDAIDGAFVEKAKKRREEERVKYAKFINNVLEGKNSHIKKVNNYYEITIGIFSMNDTNVIRLNGIDYPAYKLTLLEALEYVRYLNKTGKQVYVRAVTEAGKEVFDLIERLAFNSKGQSAIYRGLEIADSDTGAFLTLRIM